MSTSSTTTKRERCEEENANGCVVEEDKVGGGGGEVTVAGATATATATTAQAELADYPLVPKLPTSFAFFTRRYFHRYRIRNCKNLEGNNIALLVHSNSLVIVCIDTSHVIRRNDDDGNSATAGDDVADVSGGGGGFAPVSVEHVVGRGKNSRDRIAAAQNVKGKRKHNAMVCQSDTTLATVNCANGKSYKIPACVNGIVLEINPLPQQDPSVLVRAPLTSGYIAIINPRANTNLAPFELVESAVTSDGGAGLGEVDEG